MSMAPNISFDLKLPAVPDSVKGNQQENALTPEQKDIRDLFRAANISADQIQLILDRLTAAGIP